MLHLALLHAEGQAPPLEASDSSHGVSRWAVWSLKCGFGSEGFSLCRNVPTSAHASRGLSLSLWRPELPPPTLRVMLGPMSFREIQGKMELLGLQGLQDPLGPGALLATLGKMAPGEHQAQR